MDKRELILDALQALLREGKAGTASVQDIARKAGIAKGGLYYYFDSKEAVLDALVERQYAAVIAACEKAVRESPAQALDKLKLLLYVYRHTAVEASVDSMLHQPENAAIHQKSMGFILCGLSPLLTDIFEQGIREGTFACQSPRAYADTTLSVLVFLLDPGIFAWDAGAAQAKLAGLAEMLEKGLSAPKGSFAFLHENWTAQLLT